MTRVLPFPYYGTAETQAGPTMEIILPRLYERDIDVLVQEELIFNDSVQALFANELRIDAEIDIQECALSVWEPTGETDLLANYSCNDHEGILLIENKIDAEFQPLQAERYRERVDQIVKSNSCKASCVLIAPRRHIESADRQRCANFDATISYDDVASAIEIDGSPRSKHRASLILRAIEQARGAYILIPAPQVTNFWTCVYRIASAEFPALQMPLPSEKGSQSKWISFKAGLLSRITIDWKITAATVDLSLWKGALPKSIQELAFTTVPARAAFTQKGTTEMVRIRLSNPPADWIMMSDEQIREALRTSTKLLEFLENNRPLLTHRD